MKLKRTPKVDTRIVVPKSQATTTGSARAAHSVPGAARARRVRAWVKDYTSEPEHLTIATRRRSARVPGWAVALLIVALTIRLMPGSGWFRVPAGAGVGALLTLLVLRIRSRRELWSTWARSGRAWGMGSWRRARLIVAGFLAVLGVLGVATVVRGSLMLRDAGRTVAAEQRAREASAVPVAQPTAEPGMGGLEPATGSPSESGLPAGGGVLVSPPASTTAATATPSTTTDTPGAAGMSAPVAAATAAAVAFVQAWARPSVPDAQWRADAGQYATTNLVDGLSSVDPTRVPAHKVTGPGQAVAANPSTEAPAAVDVLVPTDAGQMRVSLIQQGGAWKADSIVPDDGAAAGD